MVSPYLFGGRGGKFNRINRGRADSEAVIGGLTMNSMHPFLSKAKGSNSRTQYPSRETEIPTE